MVLLSPPTPHPKSPSKTHALSTKRWITKKWVSKQTNKRKGGVTNFKGAKRWVSFEGHPMDYGRWTIQKNVGEGKDAILTE